jgi:hypothetical protein
MQYTACERKAGDCRSRRWPSSSVAWIALAGFAACAPAPVLAAVPAVVAPLSAAQVLEKNAAARGGLEAWHKIETMIWIGRIESPNAPMPSMPFVLEQKRPNKTRFEVTTGNQRALRVFDGTKGWKVIPTHEGAPELQPFTAQEVKFARAAQGIDGPLIDCEAKGISVALEGVEDIAERQTYRLTLRLPSGESHHVWVDAQSFLEVKFDRTSYNSAGVAGTVTVYYRDYKKVGGLQIPAVIETGVSGPDKPMDRLVIEKIALNPPLDDGTFSAPTPPGGHGPLVPLPVQSGGPSRAPPGSSGVPSSSDLDSTPR